MKKLDQCWEIINAFFTDFHSSVLQINVVIVVVIAAALGVV